MLGYEVAGTCRNYDTLISLILGQCLMNGCEDCRKQRFMWAFWDSDLRSLQQKATGGEEAVTIKIDQVLVRFMWLQVRIQFIKHQAIELVDYHDWLVVWIFFILLFHFIYASH